MWTPEVIAMVEKELQVPILPETPLYWVLVFLV